MSYCVDLLDAFRYAGGQVAEILRGDSIVSANEVSTDLWYKGGTADRIWDTAIASSPSRRGDRMKPALRDRRPIHHSPIFWIGVALCLAAIAIYLWSDDLSWWPMPTSK